MGHDDESVAQIARNPRRNAAELLAEAAPKVMPLQAFRAVRASSSLA